MGSALETAVTRAKEGDKAALEEVVSGIQDKVYNLALRMLHDPSDAEDAMQEILVKVITHLGGFREQSAFTTWVYRVAANHLLTMRKSLAERRGNSFEESALQIDRALAGEWRESESAAQQDMIVEEIRLACLQALLLCLDREHRLAYTLGEIFEVSSRQGAYILDISPDAFRKRLSRARSRIREFMIKHCGLINPDNRCLCSRIVPYSLETKWVKPEEMVFSEHRCRVRRNPDALARLKEMDEINRVAALFKSHPAYSAPEDFVHGLKELVESGRLDLLD